MYVYMCLYVRWNLKSRLVDCLIIVIIIDDDDNLSLQLTRNSTPLVYIYQTRFELLVKFKMLVTCELEGGERERT